MITGFWSQIMSIIVRWDMARFPKHVINDTRPEIYPPAALAALTEINPNGLSALPLSHNRLQTNALYLM
jgi:hypothetical protein